MATDRPGQHWSSPRPELRSSAAEGIGREGIVTVWDDTGLYVGCMGIETWRWLLASEHEQGAIEREPDVEKALTHLSAAAIEADIGIARSTWKSGETPNAAWWSFREAAEAISKAERALIDGRRRAAQR